MKLRLTITQEIEFDMKYYARYKSSKDAVAFIRKQFNDGGFGFFDLVSDDGGDIEFKVEEVGTMMDKQGDTYKCPCCEKVVDDSHKCEAMLKAWRELTQPKRQDDEA